MEKTLNIYAIYLVNVKTGDVDIIEKYPSFNQATKGLAELVHVDEEDKVHIGATLAEPLRIKGDTMCRVVEDNFDKLLARWERSKSFSNGFVFLKKRRKVVVYHKLTDAGWLSTDRSFERTHTLGVLEISVPMESSTEPKKVFKTEERPIQVVNEQSHACHVNVIEEMKQAILKRAKLRNAEDSRSSDSRVEARLEDAPEPSTRHMIDEVHQMRERLGLVNIKDVNRRTDYSYAQHEYMDSCGYVQRPIVEVEKAEAVAPLVIEGDCLNVEAVVHPVVKLLPMPVPRVRHLAQLEQVATDLRNLTQSLTADIVGVASTVGHGSPGVRSAEDEMYGDLPDLVSSSDEEEYYQLPSRRLRE